MEMTSMKLALCQLNRVMVRYEKVTMIVTYITFHKHTI